MSIYVPGISDIVNTLQGIAGLFSNLAGQIVTALKAIADNISLFFQWIGAVLRQSWDSFVSWFSGVVKGIISWLISVSLPPLIDQAVSISTWLYNALEPMIRQVECAFAGFVASIRRKFIKIVQYNFTVMFLRDSFRAGIRGGIGGILTVFMGMFFSPFAGLMAAYVLDQLVPQPSEGACLEMTPSLPEKTAMTAPSQPAGQPVPPPSLIVGFTPENTDITWSPISDTAQLPTAKYTLSDYTTSTFTE